MECSIRVQIAPHPHPEEFKDLCHTNLTIFSEEIFEKLQTYSLERCSVSKPFDMYFGFTIRCQYRDERWEAVESLLASHGISMRFTMRLRAEETGTVARVTTELKPTAAELKQAEYFTLFDHSNVWAPFVIEDRPEFISLRRELLATVPSYPMPVDLGPKDAKKRPRMAWLTNDTCMYISPELVASAKRAGLDFDTGEIFWHYWDGVKLSEEYPAGPPPGGYWRCETLMPPCLTDMIDQQGEPVPRSPDNLYPNGFLWDDEGNVRPRLRYRRSEVKAMEPFDFAQTLERRDVRGNKFGQYVVSRKFRDWCLKEKLKFQLTPIVLVDD